MRGGMTRKARMNQWWWCAIFSFRRGALSIHLVLGYGSGRLPDQRGRRESHAERTRKAAATDPVNKC